MRGPISFFEGDKRIVFLSTFIVVGVVIAGVIFILGNEKRGSEIILLKDMPLERNCSSNWDCLIIAADSCLGVKASTMTDSFSGVNHEIIGLENANCIYHQESYELGLNVPAEKISKGSGTCKIPTAKLVELLEKWRHGTIVVEDFSRYQCKGSFLFGFNFNRNGLLIDSQTPSGSGGGSGGGSSSGSSAEESQQGSGGETGSPPSSPPPPPSSPPPAPPSGPQCTISGPESVSIPPGASSSLSAEGFSGSSSQVSWSVDNTLVVSVSPEIGSTVKIEGKSEGSARITVTDVAFGSSCNFVINVTIQSF